MATTNNLDFTSMPFPEDAMIAARYDRVISNWGAAEALPASLFRPHR